MKLTESQLRQIIKEVILKKNPSVSHGLLKKEVPEAWQSLQANMNSSTADDVLFPYCNFEEIRFQQRRGRWWAIPPNGRNMLPMVWLEADGDEEAGWAWED